MSWDRVAVQVDWWVPAAGFAEFAATGDFDSLVEPSEKVRPAAMGLDWQVNALAHLWSKRGVIASELLVLAEQGSGVPGVGELEQLEKFALVGGTKPTREVLEWFHRLPLAARLHELVSEGSPGTVWHLSEARRDRLASWAAAQQARAGAVGSGGRARALAEAAAGAAIALEARFDVVACELLRQITQTVEPELDDMFARLVRDGLGAPLALAACDALDRPRI